MLSIFEKLLFLPLLAAAMVLAGIEFRKKIRMIKLGKTQPRFNQPLKRLLVTL